MNQKYKQSPLRIDLYKPLIEVCTYISVFVDSALMDSDILDARITKVSLVTGKVDDKYNNERYFLNDLPKTSIFHNSKDDAIFSMEKEFALFDLPLCCQLAKMYISHPNMQDIGRQYKLEAEQVKREIIKHLKHTFVHSSQAILMEDKTIAESEGQTTNDVLP